MVSSHDASRRRLLQASVAAGVGLVAGRIRLGHAADALPLIKKPIPSSKEMLPVVGLGTNNFDVGDPAGIATRKEVLQAMP